MSGNVVDYRNQSLSYLVSLEKLIPNFSVAIRSSLNLGFLFSAYNFVSQTLIFLNRHTYTQCKSLSDLVVVDWLGKEDVRDELHSSFERDVRWLDLYIPSGNRFSVIYNLLSHRMSYRILLKTCVESSLRLSSCTMYFPGAGWLEREVWDMSGILFTNHPDLRRILTDYGFGGFPLRKDFPLSGFVEVQYSPIHRRIRMDSIELLQEFRSFDIASPWAGVKL